MKNQEILIASSSKKKGEALSIITSEVFSPQTILVKTHSEAIDIASDSNFNLVIIADSLKNLETRILIKEALKNRANQVIFIVPHEDFERSLFEFQELGVIILDNPTKPSLIKVLHFVRATLIRVQGIQNQNLKLSEKIDNLKIIDRAKCILISHLNMSEVEAHKYIEKKAMNTRSSKRYIAENILKTYEN